VGEETVMQVTAISTPRYPEWRWRIKSYAGKTVEESHVGFPTTAAAMAAGSERLVSMSVGRTFGRNTTGMARPRRAPMTGIE